MLEPASGQEPEYIQEDSEASSGTSTRSWGTTLLVIVLLLLGGGYALHQRGVAKQLATQNEQMVSALKQTQGQMDALTARLNTAVAAQQQAQQAEEAAVASRSAHAARPAAARRRRVDDPRWKKVQAELDAHQKAIESTQQDLASAKTDLSGSIARTHDELVVLQRKGERNYYEFDLDKSKQFNRQGPVGLKLRKANTKHQYADLEMLVEDVSLTKKHVNLFEPVMFYAEDSPKPVELVINRITKNHIHGYISTAKYKSSELATAAGADAQAGTAQNDQAPNKVSSPAPPSAATNTPPALRRRIQ